MRNLKFLVSGPSGPANSSLTKTLLIDGLLESAFVIFNVMVCMVKFVVVLFAPWSSTLTVTVSILSPKLGILSYVYVALNLKTLASC